MTKMTYTVKYIKTKEKIEDAEYSDTEETLDDCRDVSLGVLEPYGACVVFHPLRVVEWLVCCGTTKSRNPIPVDTRHHLGQMIRLTLPLELLAILDYTKFGGVEVPHLTAWHLSFQQSNTVEKGLLVVERGIW